MYEYMVDVVKVNIVTMRLACAPENMIKYHLIGNFIHINKTEAPYTHMRYLYYVSEERVEPCHLLR
jgi:hypothetical protein